MSNLKVILWLVAVLTVGVLSVLILPFLYIIFVAIAIGMAVISLLSFVYQSIKHDREVQKREEAAFQKEVNEYYKNK